MSILKPGTMCYTRKCGLPENNGKVVEVLEYLGISDIFVTGVGKHVPKECYRVKFRELVKGLAGGDPNVPAYSDIMKISQQCLVPISGPDIDIDTDTEEEKHDKVLRQLANDIVDGNLS